MTNFRLFQTERVCRRQFHIWRKWQRVIQTSRKHCGKRKNCSLRAIYPFPTVFSKGLFPRGVKRCLCWNGLTLNLLQVTLFFFFVMQKTIFENIAAEGKFVHKGAIFALAKIQIFNIYVFNLNPFPYNDTF